MPDHRIPREDPRNWSEAFAALPLATPERDAWSQLAREIHPAKIRNRRPLWWSMAAALALLAALPLAWRERGDASGAPDAVVSTPSTTPEPATPPIALPRDAATAQAVADEVPDSPTVSVPEAAPVRVAESSRKRTQARQLPRPTVVESPGADSLATTHATDQEALQSLYAQSAQLEGLLAQVRDERMTSGPAAALAGQLEARLALIDASLSQPSLEAGQRADLWRERVGALQQLAGFESTQRWLTAQGERYDGQLVAVY